MICVQLTPSVSTSRRASHQYGDQRGQYTYHGNRWMYEMIYRKRDDLH
jgi:hypothetical protein